ncbi:MAG TPA: DUF4390 domain-containing protein [Gammaproteobacteria bacterium]
MSVRQRLQAGFGWAAALAGLLLVSLPVAAAERFEIRNAFAEPVDGVWQLNANMDLSLSEAAREALHEGISLTVLLDVEITAERGFMPDKGVAELAQRWSLAYDALSQRYVTTNLNSRAQSTQATLEEALEDLSRVRGLPLVDAALLRVGRRHEISLRASIEIGGLPDAVKVLIFWRDWSVATDWYTWSIRP